MKGYIDMMVAIICQSDKVMLNTILVVVLGTELIHGKSHHVGPGKYMRLGRIRVMGSPSSVLLRVDVTLHFQGICVPSITLIYTSGLFST
jgi:hypothetical protein